MLHACDGCKLRCIDGVPRYSAIVLSRLIVTPDISSYSEATKSGSGYTRRLRLFYLHAVFQHAGRVPSFKHFLKPLPPDHFHAVPNMVAATPCRQATLTPCQPPVLETRAEGSSWLLVLSGTSMRTLEMAAVKRTLRAAIMVLCSTT